MSQRVGLRRSGNEGNTFRPLETHVQLEGEHPENEKRPTCCVELNQRLQELQNRNEKLAKKCSSKAAEMRDMEAHSNLMKEENRKLKQKLKEKEDDIKRMNRSKQNPGLVWSELQETRAEIAEKTCCREYEKELQRLRKELIHLRDEPCMRSACSRIRAEKSTLKLQLEQLERELQQARSYTEQNNQLQEQDIKFRDRVDEITKEVQTLREGKKMLQREVESKDAQLQEKATEISCQQSVLHTLREENEIRRLQEKVEESNAQLQERDTLVSRHRRELHALREERGTLHVEMEGKNTQIQERDIRLQQQAAELQEKARQISRQERELQTQKEEWDTQVRERNIQIQQQDAVLQETATQIRRLETTLQKMEDKSKQQQRTLSEKEGEIESMQKVLQQKIYDYRSQQARLQSEFELEKEKILEDNRFKSDRMLSEKKELTREVDRLKTLTCEGKDCPSVYLQIMTSDIMETIGKVENKQTGGRLSLVDLMTSLASGQTSLHVQLQELQKQQQQLLQQRSFQSCATCSAKENQYSSLKEAYRQLQRQNQDSIGVARRHEKTIQELEKQLHSGQCQRPDCVKLRKEQRQKEIQLIGKMGSPGKDMDKQRVVEHDQLIHEFERLTTDPDGLLGVLEDTLHEHGDDANFEAKRLLCGLFQESYNCCKQVVLHEIKTQLESLFKVQSTPKSEEMEDASRGYGLLLHAFGLRTEEMRAKYSAKIKTKIYSEISQDETLHKVKKTLERSHEDHFGKAIALAWKFVTLSNPLIVCQPKGFNAHTHSPEFGHWEKHAKEFELIYTRPVIYRNYEGMLACKGWVANTATSGQKSKCLLS